MLQGSSRKLQQQLSQQQATQQQMASQQATQQQLPQQQLADQQLPQKALGAIGTTLQQGADQVVQELPQQVQQQLPQQAAGDGQGSLSSATQTQGGQVQGSHTQGSQNQGSQHRRMEMNEQGGADAQLNMDKCFRDYNPATKEGYQDVVATWLAALLTLAEHLAANPRASLLKNDADQHQLPLPPVPPFKQDLAA